MTRRAVILHGTDANPEANWFPWLKKKLEEQGYEVWVPQLPNCHTPNRHTYNDFLFGEGWDFTNNIVIGHSSGAVSVLNLLMDPRCPHVKLGAMVSAWANNNPSQEEALHLKELGLDVAQFTELFPPENFDFEMIKNNADKLIFLHGAKDPYCPLEQAEYLAGELHAQLAIVPDGDHLGEKYPELPELWQLISKYL